METLNFIRSFPLTSAHFYWYDALRTLICHIIYGRFIAIRPINLFSYKLLLTVLMGITKWLMAVFFNVVFTLINLRANFSHYDTMHNLLNASISKNIQYFVRYTFSGYFMFRLYPSNVQVFHDTLSKNQCIKFNVRVIEKKTADTSYPSTMCKRKYC